MRRCRSAKAGGSIDEANAGFSRTFYRDDVIAADSVHGAGGAWGTLAAGMFKIDALFNLAQMQVQLIGIAVAYLRAFSTALIADALHQGKA